MSPQSPPAAPGGVQPAGFGRMMTTAPQSIALSDLAGMIRADDWRTLLPALAECWRRQCECDGVVVTKRDVGTGWSVDGDSGFQVTPDDSPMANLIARDVRNIANGRVGIQLFTAEETSPVVIPDDLVELTSTLIVQLDERLARLRRFDQDEAARRWEKLESLAEFAAGAGHEINNPVATITGRAAQLLRDETDPDRRRSLATIGGQALRIRDMIGDVMLFARPPEPRPESVGLKEVVDRVVAQLAEEIGAKQCAVKVEGDTDLMLFADVSQLEVVLSNLLRNALEAIDDGGEVVIKWEFAPNGIQRNPPADAGGSPWLALIEVVDNGRGFTEVERRHLFDPFFSGRQAGRGLGFGLCKCWRIVSNHGGRIDVESQPGQTRFRIEWPIATNVV